MPRKGGGTPFPDSLQDVVPGRYCLHVIDSAGRALTAITQECFEFVGAAVDPAAPNSTHHSYTSFDNDSDARSHTSARSHNSSLGKRHSVSSAQVDHSETSDCNSYNSKIRMVERAISANTNTNTNTNANANAITNPSSLDAKSPRHFASFDELEEAGPESVGTGSCSSSSTLSQLDSAVGDRGGGKGDRSGNGNGNGNGTRNGNGNGDGYHTGGGGGGGVSVPDNVDYIMSSARFEWMDDAQLALLSVSQLESEMDRNIVSVVEQLVQVCVCASHISLISHRYIIHTRIQISWCRCQILTSSSFYLRTFMKTLTLTSMHSNTDSTIQQISLVYQPH
jgi:hypothetical protein